MLYKSVSGCIYRYMYKANNAVKNMDRNFQIFH